MRKFWRTWLLVCALAVLATPSHAFGLRTHLWIAQQILNDVIPDCRVTLRGVEFRVRDDACQSIRSNPGAFLAGALGPDAFPDLVTGQVTTHPGIEGDWLTSQWLKHLYEGAPSGQPLSFGAGYLVHAACDTFAHTYVNAYAGDVFILSDERAVELRHFALEKYIDYRLPPGMPDPASMRTPSSYLAMKLILNSDAARTGAKSGFALHIPAMYGVYTAVGSLDRKLDSLEGDAGQALARLITLSGELGLQIADGEAALRAAEVGLAVNEERLKIEQQAYDTASDTLNDAVKALRANEELIIQSDLRVKVGEATIAESRRAIERANNEIDNARRAVERLEGQLAGLPRTVQRRICEEVRNRVCRNLPWPLGEACDWATSTSCRVVDVANEAWEDVNNELRRARGRALDLEAQIRRAQADIAAETATIAVELETKARAEAVSASLRAGEEAARAAFAIMEARYRLELAATQEARQQVASLRDRLADLRARLVDTESIRKAIAELVDRSNILSFYTKNWIKGMELSSAKLIDASMLAATRLTTGEGGAVGAYSEWLTCYGGAFTPVPYQTGEFGCQVVAAYQQLSTEFDKLVLRVLPEPFATLYRRVEELKAELKAEVKEEAEDAALELVKLAAPDASTAQLIELMARPENATGARLDEIYATVGDAGGKQLLTYPRVTELVNADLGLSADKLDPAAFKALAHAVAFSKLALLDEGELERLVRRFGGDADKLTMTASPRYSVLFDALRSIDGNHQWQPYALPYPRSAPPAEPTDPQKRHYGYGPADGTPKGLHIFIDPGLRVAVFNHLFPAPVGGAIMQRPELNLEAYKFPECVANPFPVAFNADGTPASEDRTCALVADPNQTPKVSFGVRWRRFWRSLFGGF